MLTELHSGASFYRLQGADGSWIWLLSNCGYDVEAEGATLCLLCPGPAGWTMTYSDRDVVGHVMGRHAPTITRPPVSFATFHEAVSAALNCLACRVNR